MEGALFLPSLAVVFLSQLWSGNCLCILENGTMARCHELDDVRYIETYDLESLKASVDDKVLRAGLFSNLSSLKHLDLSGGDLKSVEPGSLRELDQLRSLDLSDNAVDYLELASLNGLHHLHSLNLRRNNLTQLPPALLRLKSLRHLDIQGNPFECNCATLRVRDLLVKRGVKLSKKVICVGPGNMKGTSLLKPDAEIICAFEEQDKEMLNDQAAEGSGDVGSGEPFDDWSTEEEEAGNEKEEPVIVEETSIGPTEIETPFPETVSVTSTTEEVTVDETPANKTAQDDNELFFDSDEKNSTGEVAEKKEIKDGLFYPVEEGSGDEDEGSGLEGSGTGILFRANEESDNEHEVTSAKPSTTTEGEGLFDMLWGAFWGSTDAPEEDETDLESEEFINVSTSESAPEVREEIPAVTHHPLDAKPGVKPAKIDAKSSVPTNNADLSIFDESKTDDKFNAAVKADDSVEDIAEVSPAKQSKKGMGSYVVLAALLVVLAALIGFAAYKGDFCRKKRKRDDIETGTELKDMQKALLDTGNSTQPKIASNGNAENAPLMGNSTHQDDSKAAEACQKTDSKTAESPKSTNGTTVVDSSDPVKPPRKAATPQEESAKVHETPAPELHSAASGPQDDSLAVAKSPAEPVAPSIPKDAVSCEPQQSNGPPLSPGAQRVKITLQENPDSVPRTPILITRTLAGENLVKTP